MVSCLCRYLRIRSHTDGGARTDGGLPDDNICRLVLIGAGAGTTKDGTGAELMILGWSDAYAEILSSTGCSISTTPDDRNRDGGADFRRLRHRRAPKIIATVHPSPANTAAIMVGVVLLLKTTAGVMPLDRSVVVDVAEGEGVLEDAGVEL